MNKFWEQPIIKFQLSSSPIVESFMNYKEWESFYQEAF